MSKYHSIRMSRLLLFIFVVYSAAAIGVNFVLAQEAPKEEPPEVEGNLRDPFIAVLEDALLTQPDKEGPALEDVLFPMVLKGIMKKDGRSVAIINEEVVSEGQIWHNLRVEHIDKDGVVLSYQGKEIKLAMKELEVK